MVTLYSHLECSSCKKHFDKNILQSFCKECSQPLIAMYNIGRDVPKTIIDSSINGLWRYKKILPIQNEHNIVSLGEGGTPISEMKLIAQQFGLKHPMLMKDESCNATGSFKARGMSVAISKAKEFNVKKCCTPTAGNAGSAMAAYCAKAGIAAKVYMPVLTPKMFSYDTALMGAEIIKVDGSIRDAGLAMQRDNTDNSMWDLSTMKEPFRLEGKKTIGYEIAEQLKWQLPDVIFYPTGGGTGLIGIWKAFQEMKTMAWLDHVPTQMAAVQLEGCDPIVQAYEKKQDVSHLCEYPMPTAANGLRVPKAFGDKMILKAIYESNGFAVRVKELDMIHELNNVATTEGMFLSPEGAALFSAVKQCLKSGQIKSDAKIMVINTGSGYKYVENLW